MELTDKKLWGKKRLKEISDWTHTELDLRLGEYGKTKNLGVKQTYPASKDTYESTITAGLKTGKTITLKITINKNKGDGNEFLLRCTSPGSPEIGNPNFKNIWSYSEVFSKETELQKILEKAKMLLT